MMKIVTSAVLFASLAIASSAPAAREFKSAGAFVDAATQLPFADDPSGARSGVPDYELQTLKGSTMRLSSLRGKVVLLDFFLANCWHCQEHAPFVADLVKRYRARGLVVVGMCSNNPFTEREIVEEYVKKSNLDAEIAFVPSDVMQSILKQREDGRYGVPEAVLFGADGKFVTRFTEWEAPGRPAIERAIEQQLSAKK